MAPLRVAIVGSGISGLVAALSFHHLCPHPDLSPRPEKPAVTIYEAASGLHTAGAGIHIPPNAVRILRRLGVLDAIAKMSEESAGLRFLRWEDGAELFRTKEAENVKHFFDDPILMIHRHDLQKCLADGVKAAGIPIEFNAGVVDVSEGNNAARLELRDGRVVEADLVVGADGVGSAIRRGLGSATAQLDPTPKPAWIHRALIPRATMQRDEDTAALHETKDLTLWLGNKGHLIGYPVSRGEFYNFASCQDEALAETVAAIRDSHKRNADGADPGESWDVPTDKESMKKIYAEYEPRVRKMTEWIEDVRGWRTAEVPRLKSWSGLEGKAVLVGDAAHAMLPYAGQGGALSIEDAAVVVLCVAREGCTKEGLPGAARAYEALRRKRVESVAQGARNNGVIWHLPDGPEQQERDARMKQMREKQNQGDYYSEKDTKKEMPQGWIYAYNAFDEVEQYYSGQNGHNGHA